MDIEEDEELEEKFFLSQKEKEQIKQKLLDEDFKKASQPKKDEHKDTKKIVKISEKKSFSKIGIGLIIVAVICLLILNLVPWLYIKFDSNIENKTLEEIYYKDFEDGENQSAEVLNFFQSGNSSRYLGLALDDFISISKKAAYVFYAIIILGVVLTIFEIISKKLNFAFEKIIIVRTFFSAIVAILCIYLIFIIVKFFGVHFLIYYNISYISSNLPNIVLLFFAPVFLIFITAGLLKLLFTTMKLNFNLFEKTLESKQPKKSLYIYKQGGKIK
jgi:hypothetical protein